MNMVKLTIVLVLLATIICALLLIVYAYKRRTMPGAKYFIMLLFSAIAYSGAYIGEITATDFTTAMFWFYVQHIPIPIQHYLWLMMSLEYSRVPQKYLNIAKYVGLYHPIIYMLIFFTNDFHHLYISAYSFESNGHFFVITSVKGPLYGLMVMSGTLLGVIALFFYLRGLINSSRFHKYGYLIMIIASLIPWVTVYLNATNTGYLGIDYFPVVSIFSGILYVLGIFYFRVFNTIPIATEIVYRQAKEGVALIDVTDHLIDANDAFLKIYPETSSLLKNPRHKYTLSSFLKQHPELEGLEENSPILEFSFGKKGEERYYSAEITRIVLEDNLTIGKILTVNNITLFVESKKTLEQIAVIAIDKAETNEISFLQAQINPHFLNNTLSVIGAMIKRDPDGAKELIGNLGEYLANSCYFDNTSPMVLLEDELETVNTYIFIENKRFGERLKYHTVWQHIPNINVPRLILQPLIENSIRHGILRKAEGGNVWLIISEEDMRVSFEIKDDGVGIAPAKMLGLTWKENERQGIGLYNIHSRLLKYYGEGLKIESELGKGTSVKFSIPYQS